MELSSITLTYKNIAELKSHKQKMKEIGITIIDSNEDDTGYLDYLYIQYDLSGCTIADISKILI